MYLISTWTAEYGIGIHILVWDRFSPVHCYVILILLYVWINWRHNALARNGPWWELVVYQLVHACISQYVFFFTILYAYRKETPWNIIVSCCILM